MITLKRNLCPMEHKYIIDANVFITAHRQIYPFDIVPSFWEQLVDKAADKIVIIEDVQEEIINSVNDNAQYKQSAKDEFASVADSWLCAYALKVTFNSAVDDTSVVTFATKRYKHGCIDNSSLE